MAEACGGRTHQPVISGFAGFEDQEGHRAHSASEPSQNSEENKMLSSYFRRQVVGQFEACESLRDRSSDSSLRSE